MRDFDPCSWVSALAWGLRRRLAKSRRNAMAGPERLAYYGIPKLNIVRVCL
jgi:hypothetical protein